MAGSRRWLADSCRRHGQRTHPSHRCRSARRRIRRNRRRSCARRSIPRSPWRKSTMVFSCSLDTSKSSRRLAWLASINRPSSAASPLFMASPAASVRAFSLTTWRARRRVVSARRPAAPITSSTVTSRKRRHAEEASRRHRSERGVRCRPNRPGRGAWPCREWRPMCRPAAGPASSPANGSRSEGVAGQAGGRDHLVHDPTIHADPAVFGALPDQRHGARLPGYLRQGGKRAGDGDLQRGRG